MLNVLYPKNYYYYHYFLKPHKLNLIVNSMEKVFSIK